ncbi:DMT family transporter [Abyssibius alkaniclasticus]|uniref:DMT family transporter n=1 Tax=Abyssibius alkaniclasticus TaxID=2881234 RepID=UPI0023647431|nr:DMT family transporter [Abyssibius alkaniclasticus]UPH70436.1 DMT family transporter [Abyssibius alkaniclasticus]
MQRLGAFGPPLVLALTLAIWASFLVSARAAVGQSFGPIEVGLMRFGTAAILFAPVLLRHGILPRGQNWLDVVLIAFIGGFVFVLLLVGGLSFAPVADSGIFAPSMLPVWVAGMSAVFLAEKFSRARLLGLGLIVFGALAVGGYEAIIQAEDGRWRGHLLFLGASGCWAAYTVRFRARALPVVPAAAMMVFWSALAFLVAGLVKGMDFSGIPPQTLALQILLQGVFSGFLATFTYLFCVQHFGAAKTAAFGALVPVLAALGAWVFLAEPIGIFKTIGILVVCTGVALASGALFQGRSQ